VIRSTAGAASSYQTIQIKSVPVCAGLCQSVQVCASLCRSVQVCASLCRSAGLCQSVQVCAGQCKSVQVSAGLCQSMQVCAGQQVCASLCRSVPVCASLLSVHVKQTCIPMQTVYSGPGYLASRQLQLVFWEALSSCCFWLPRT